MNDYEKLATNLHSHIRSRTDEFIICAANWYNDGRSHSHQPINIEQGFIIAGRRHHNCFVTESILTKGGKKIFTIEDGFLTSKDRFVNREEAGKIAFNAGQIKQETNCLFSEDLY